MSFNPRALDESTLKQFVDRLYKLHKAGPCPAPATWPPKRSAIQEEVARMLGFPNWHQAITAIGKRSSLSPPPPTDVSTKGFGDPVPRPFDLSDYREAEQLTLGAFEDVLRWAAQSGASDVVIQSGARIGIEKDGLLRSVGQRKPAVEELFAIIKHLAGDNSLAAAMTRAEPLDLVYQVTPTRGAGHFRFRINVTAFTQGNYGGWAITCRVVPNLAPTLGSLSIENDLFETLTQEEAGIILVTGQAGAGKTTLISSIIRHQVEESPKRVLTYECPVEFVYEDLEMRGSVIQHAVPANIRSFAAGLRNSLRRKPSVIMIGELRDNETLSEIITASRTGHQVLTGMVAPSVADTLSRLYRMSNGGAQFNEVISELSVIVSQILVPSVTGHRLALRESLVLNDDEREVLLSASNDEQGLSKVVRSLLAARGEGFVLDARRKFSAGLISAQTLKRIERQFM